MTALRTIRIAAYAGIALLVAGLAVWFVAGGALEPPPGNLAVGGPFTLTSQTGETFDSATLEGQPYVVFFGFSHCPEVCPTTLYELSRDLKALDPESKDLRVLFVTVDPERDTPAFLADYVANFDPRILGLTGTPEQIAATAKRFHVFYERVPTSDGSYTMNHTALAFLMDRKGRFFGTLDYEEGDEVKLEKLRRLLREG